MVVDGDRERLLGDVLTDDVLVEELVDLAGLGEFAKAGFRGLAELLLDDLVAEVDALVTDIDARAGDELLDLLLALATEGALEEIAAFAYSRHEGRLPDVREGGALIAPLASSGLWALL